MKIISTIAERMREAMRLRNIKQTDIVKLTGIGKSSISTYLTGEYEPKQRNIYKIAQALNVNEAWLMGYDVPMERISNSTRDAKPIDDLSDIRMASYNGVDLKDMSDEEIEEIKQFVTFVRSKRNKDKQKKNGGQNG